MISSSHDDLLCGQESGGPYSCRVANSLFISNQAYTFQVAANNNEGVGSFSYPITKSIPMWILQGTSIDHVINSYSIVISQISSYKPHLLLQNLYNSYLAFR